MVDLEAALGRHARIGLDTTVFIYHLESVDPFAAPASRVLRSLGVGSITGVTSVVTLAELLVQPLQRGLPELAASYEVLVRAVPALSVVDVDVRVARRTAALRAKYPVRTPDALQVAACLELGAPAFVTNDRRLRQITEIEVLVLGDFLVT